MQGMYESSVQGISTPPLPPAFLLGIDGLPSNHGAQATYVHMLSKHMYDLISALHPLKSPYRPLGTHGLPSNPGPQVSHIKCGWNKQQQPSHAIQPTDAPNLYLSPRRPLDVDGLPS